MIRTAVPSSAPGRLGAFAAAMVLVFAGSFGVGRALGDASSSDRPAPAHHGPTTTVPAGPAATDGSGDHHEGGQP